ncbi:uncharacterized protein [Spinacia oleracea]|uniref:Reverse transcriptase domain-containing protein n=1 Tax=Spinacia oleracea TaxID=3562 RepID=A0ABM3QYW2_SPIOL|nr:uncharacterized protein LOC130463465 [Spinacia oleracea]
MDCDLVYNFIMGRTMIHKMQAILYTYHQMMMYVSDAGFAERIRGDHEIARRTCHTAIQKSRLGDGPEDDDDKDDRNQEPSHEEQEAKKRKVGPGSLVKPVEVDARLEGPSPEPDQEMEDIFLEVDSDRSVRIGKGLSPGLRIELIQLLRDHKDIFAWSAADIPRIDPKMICHKMDVNVKAQPIKQKKRNYSSEKNKSIAEEVKRLQEAREKTTFSMSAGVFNYRMMPFGSKNVGATYQRLVDHVFPYQKGRNVEVYVDDSIVKKHQEGRPHQRHGPSKIRGSIR